MISNRLWKILVTFKSCKTLSATAERLFVSQPSISSSMKMLEKELGVQLFDRSKNKIVLNEVGLEAAQLAEDYLKREDFMVRQIQEKAWQMRTLTVASYIFNLRKDLVSRLSVLFPERNIISEQLSSEQLPLGLLQGRFDYIITEYEIDEPNVCCVPYVTDKLWIRLNKNDPLAHKRSIDINDLKNEKILLWAQSGFWASYIRKQYGQIVQLRGIAPDDHRNGAAVLLRHALFQRGIDLHALVAQRPGREDLPAHDALEDESRRRMETVGRIQKQRRNGGRNEHDNDPEYASGDVLAADGFGEQAPHELFRRRDQLPDPHDRVRDAVRVAEQQIDKKADQQRDEMVHRFFTPAW